jgi:hypothetical protein
MTARVSLLGRCLEPLAAGLWIIFLIWTAFIAVVWSCGIGQGGLGAIGNRDLRAALEWLIGIGDVLWITLAAANVHLWLAEAEGLATARRWALLVIGSAVALALLSALSGFPLGTIVYSRQLGVQLGPIPFGLPLLWFAIFISARQLVLRVWPRISQAGLAAAVGALALLTDLNLESVAAKARGWWLWKASTPAIPASLPGALDELRGLEPDAGAARFLSSQRTRGRQPPGDRPPTDCRFAPALRGLSRGQHRPLDARLTCPTGKTDRPAARAAHSSFPGRNPTGNRR